MFCSLRLLLWCEYACLTWYKQTSKSLRVSHSKHILKRAELHSMNSTRREKVRHIGRLLFYSESISPYLSITMETVAINEKSHSHLNRPCGLSSFVPLVTSLVLTVIDNFNTDMSRGRKYFLSYSKENDSVKQAREKNAKTHLKLTRKFQKQPTFRDATIGFLAKWRLRNERRHSILMARHYPDLGSASDWLKQNFLPISGRSDTSSVRNFCALFNKRHFVRKPVVASRNVGCFLRVLATRTTFSIISPPLGVFAPLKKKNKRMRRAKENDKKTAWPATKSVFRQDFQGRVGNNNNIHEEISISKRTFLVIVLYSNLWEILLNNFELDDNGSVKLSPL